MSERDVRLFELRELLARLAGDDALVSPETAEVSLLLRRAVDRLAAVDEAVDPLLEPAQSSGHQAAGPGQRTA